MYSFIAGCFVIHTPGGNTGTAAGVESHDPGSGAEHSSDSVWERCPNKVSNWIRLVVDG